MKKLLMICVTTSVLALTACSKSEKTEIKTESPAPASSVTVLVTPASTAK